ncbi:hypothetical protein AA313_de0207754 [Arthrobotrys entomopaga]|nr:hypothetical protein AA313_de0207754 [Arthrobotrys entomopaga]
MRVLLTFFHFLSFSLFGLFSLCLLLIVNYCLSRMNTHTHQLLLKTHHLKSRYETTPPSQKVHSRVFHRFNLPALHRAPPPAQNYFMTLQKSTPGLLERTNRLLSQLMTMT